MKIMNRFGPHAQGHMAMLAFSAIVACSFSLGARVGGIIDPLALTLPRVILACAMMWTLARLTGQPVGRRHLQAGWRWLLLGGIYSAYFVMMFEALETATPISTAAIFTLSPVMSAIIGWVLLRQVTRARTLGAIAIGAAGALWVIFRGDIDAMLRFQMGRGEVIYLVACALHAALPATIMRTRRGEPPLVASALMLGGAVITLLPFAIGPALSTDWTAMPAIVWITLAYVSVMATGVTTFLIGYASPRLNGPRIMAYTYLVPSWVIGWELILGGTAPPAIVLGGIALTILALLLLLRPDPVRA